MLLASKIGLYNIAMDLGTNILKLCILFEALKIVTKQNYIVQVDMVVLRMNCSDVVP